MKREKDRLNRVVVIGATPSGITATNKLAELGIPVTLLDSSANLDDKLSREEWRLDSGVPLNHAHRPGLIRIMRNASIRKVLPSRVDSIRHNTQGFKVAYTREQTFVNPERCTLCGNCKAACPVCTEESEKAVNIVNRLALPGRPVIDKRQTPLCVKNCPLGVNAQGYIALAKVGKFNEALALIRKKNVLPGICGRICHHPCEGECRRGEIDDAVSIRNIKRFLADYELENPVTDEIVTSEKRDESVVIVGSGPSGLAAAAEFARAGVKVTILEKEEKAGGLLRYGIGPHRLPREILDREIEVIEKMGVGIKTGTSVDLEGGMDALRKKYDGVLLTTGSWADRTLNVPGENLDGVEGCLSFLNRFYRDEIALIQENVAVVGDGNAAFDLARTLVRLGAAVTVVSWFEKAAIPADPEELEAAIEEKVVIKDGIQVVEFLGENGRFSALKVMPTKPGKPDKNGICWPVIKEAEKASELSFDRVFVAVGQKGALEKSAKKSKGPTVNEHGYLFVDGKYRTTGEKVYATGDGVTGPSSVVQAMASGRAAAGRMLADLCGMEVEELSTDRASGRDFDPVDANTPVVQRNAMPEKAAAERGESFTEVAEGLSADQVMGEAKRCLDCGVCSECLECESVCGATGALVHDEAEEAVVENCGVVIIADPAMAPSVKGDDVIRAYGPKSSKSDVHAMMTRGFASAAKAMTLLSGGFNMMRGRGLTFTRSGPGLQKEVRTGVFVCRCNDALGWSDTMSSHVESLVGRCDVVHAETVPSACVPEGIQSIARAVKEKGVTRIVLASCVCCPLNFVCSACTDQRSRLKHGLFHATGIGRSMVETCNIRGEVLPLLEGNPEEAHGRFSGLLHRSIKRAGKLTQYPSPERIYNFTTAVIGESPSVVNSAETLAEAGMEVVHFGGPGDKGENAPVHSNILDLSETRVKAFSGTLGDFHIIADTDGGEQTFQVGAVILGEKTRRKLDYIHQEGLPGRPVTSFMQKDGESGVPFFYPGMTSIAGLFLADPPGVNVSNLKKGAAAAVLAAAVMPREPRQSKGFTVTVDENLCRGCARCKNVCNYQAISFGKNELDGWCATVDEALCKGCGNCISVCPANAVDSPYRNQAFLGNTLEEILLR